MEFIISVSLSLYFNLCCTWGVGCDLIEVVIHSLLGDLGSGMRGGQGMHTLLAHPSYKRSEYADSYHNIKNTKAYGGLINAYIQPDDNNLHPLPKFFS